MDKFSYAGLGVLVAIDLALVAIIVMAMRFRSRQPSWVASTRRTVAGTVLPGVWGVRRASQTTA